MDEFRTELKAIAEKKIREEDAGVGMNLVDQMKELKGIEAVQKPTLYTMQFKLEKDERQKILNKISKLKKRLELETQQDVLIWIFENLVEM
jgi:transposase